MSNTSEGVVVSKEDVQMVREWLKKKPLLPQIDDYFIKSMIAVKKGSVQKAKMLLENFFYYSCHLMPHITPDGEIFTDRFEKFNKLFYLCTLPQRTPEGYKVIVSRIEKENHNVDHFQEAEYYFRSFQNYLVPLFEGDYGNGEFIFIADYSGITIEHFKTSNIQFLSSLAKGYGKNAYPVRLKGIHLLSIPKIVEWMVFKPFQLGSEKMQKRMMVHHDLASLHKVVPVDILPEELGGSAGPIKNINDDFTELIRKHEDSLKKFWSNCLNMKGQLPELEDDTADTFKKLEID